jgi:folate-dependent phosphoribosylglycinamide formyltransferase PurN
LKAGAASGIVAGSWGEGKVISPIHDPGRGPFRLAALMSGSGTNVRRILEHGERLREREGRRLFEVAVIFSDVWDSNAVEIGRDFDLPVVTRDLRSWMKKRGVARRELDRREDFDRDTVRALESFGCPAAIYGGYMAIASPTLINAYMGINVHPADLSAADQDGRRKWRGAHAVADAIAAGENFIRATTHLVTQEVDTGPLLMISAPLGVEIPAGTDLSDAQELRKVADHNQDRLKEAGDWLVFPRTIEEIARGWFGRDESGAVYYRGSPIPNGLKL